VAAGGPTPIRVDTSRETPDAIAGRLLAQLDARAPVAARHVQGAGAT